MADDAAPASASEGSGSTGAVSAGVAGPAWLYDLLGISAPREGEEVRLSGRRFVCAGGVLRARDGSGGAAQRQTGRTFGYKWKRRESFDSPASLARMRSWLVERYGDVARAGFWKELGAQPLVVDAGCGAALSALELFGKRLAKVRYLGVDLSDAVDVARRRFEERGLSGAFLQVDLGAIPLARGSVDLIFSEGVLHHTDSTREALLQLAELLAPGGRFLFYVYRRKGPIREFTDDYLRERLQALPPDEAWERLMPLTRLGQALGDLDLEVEVPEEVDLLGIPAGRIPIQRLFYWHVFKAFYDPELSLEELHHINFDWYAPANAHRQSPEEVRAWCAEAGLAVEREVLEPAGITIVARRPR